MVVYNVDSIIEIGASAVGMHFELPLSNYKLREWNSAFGVRPEVCTDAWAIIHAHADRDGHSVLHFFWCLHFKRTYQNEQECARSLKTNPKTLRERVKAMTILLSLYMPKVINWGMRQRKTKRGEKFPITVDGTHLLIEEIYLEDGKTPDPAYYSHKFQASALSYEVAIAIFSDNIVWINGPFPAGTSDLKIFNEHGLSNLLSVCKEKAIGDSGYPSNYVSQKGEGSHDWKVAKSRYRARQESVNERMKIFKCLQDRWRHDEERHKHTFRAVAFLTQLSFQYNPLMDSIE